MVTRTSSTRRTPAFSATQSSLQPSPTISSIVVTDSSYVDLDDTAIGTTGGYIKIKGFGFTANSLVLFNGANVTNTYVSSTEYRAVVPATSAGTYNVMIFNNNIGAIFTGASVSGFPTWTTSSYTNLSLDVSVQLIASGDAPLTYSLFSGSLPSGTSLSANGLISGTVSADSTSTFDVIVNDAQNQTTQQTITLTIVSSDTYWENTCLLLNGEISSNISVYEDASTLKSAVTINGDTRPAAKSPFASPQLTDGSAFFDGTGDWLAFADSASLRIGTSSFTIEGWFYATTISAAQRGIVSKGATLENTGFEIRIDGASGGQLATTFTSTVVKGTTVIALNTWYHFALVRNGTAVNLYVNGTSEATATRTDDFSQTESLLIGNSRNTSQLFIGYISNVRITKQALYTANFTPSTVALTTTSQGANSANVIFLGCQTNLSNENTKVVDLSRNDYTITRNTSPTVSTFSPYGNNWSVFFDGTGDYINSANTAACNMGSGNFTIEGWFYCTSTTSPQRIINNWDTGSPSIASWEILLSSGTTLLFTASTAGASNAFSLSGSVPIQTWHHFAAVRSGNTFTLYINGNSVGSNTQSITLQAGNTVTIASRRSGSTSNVEPFFGYVSNIRVAKQALYTANFTPSTTALTTTSQGATAANVTLLTCKSNQIIDLSGSASTLTRANDAIVTKFSPFGGLSSYSANTYGGSNFFNGTTDYLALPFSTTLSSIGTSDFTIEAWVFNTNSAIPAANNFIYDARNGTSVSGNRPVIALGTGATGYMYFVANTNQITSGSSVVKLRQWQHIAVSRFSGNTKMFVDGVQAGSTWVDATSYSTGTVIIGAGNGTAVTGWMPGYITDVRTTIGTALYTTTFTPNTSPLTTSSNTRLLLNGTNSGVIDSAMLNTITTSGNAISTLAVTKFGNRSLFFDGTGDYLTITNSFDNYNFGTGNLTFEMWVYPTTVTKAMTIVDTRSGGASTTGMIPFEMNTSGNVIVSIGGSQLFTGSTPLVANTWTHLAVVRAGTNVTLYINGTKPTTGNGTSAATVSDNFLTVGTSVASKDTTATNHFQGYIDDLRITKGLARYGANFTVPNNTFPAL